MPKKINVKSTGKWEEFGHKKIPNTQKKGYQNPEGNKIPGGDKPPSGSSNVNQPKKTNNNG